MANKKSTKKALLGASAKRHSSAGQPTSLICAAKTKSRARLATHLQLHQKHQAGDRHKPATRTVPPGNGSQLLRGGYTQATSDVSARSRREKPKTRSTRKSSCFRSGDSKPGQKPGGKGYGTAKTYPSYSKLWSGGGMIMTRKRYKATKFPLCVQRPKVLLFSRHKGADVSGVTPGSDPTHCVQCRTKLRLSLRLQRVWAQDGVAKSPPWLCSDPRG